MSETVNPDAVAKDQLTAFVERIMRLLSERDDVMALVKEVYAEAQGNGFNKTALGQVVSILRKKAKDADAFNELEMTVELYLSSLAGTEPAITRAHTHETSRAA